MSSNRTFQQGVLVARSIGNSAPQSSRTASVVHSRGNTLSIMLRVGEARPGLEGGFVVRISFVVDATRSRSLVKGTAKGQMISPLMRKALPVVTTTSAPGGTIMLSNTSSTLLQITTTDRSACTGNWTTLPILGATFCAKTSGDAGCHSIYTASALPYNRVRGFFTLYQYGTPDAFHPYYANSLLGDSLSVWAGDVLLWDYVVGLSVEATRGLSCPPFRCWALLLRLWMSKCPRYWRIFLSHAPLWPYVPV